MFQWEAKVCSWWREKIFPDHQPMGCREGVWKNMYIRLKQNKKWGDAYWNTTVSPVSPEELWGKHCNWALIMSQTTEVVELRKFIKYLMCAAIPHISQGLQTKCMWIGLGVGRILRNLQVKWRLSRKNFPPMSLDNKQVQRLTSSTIKRKNKMSTWFLLMGHWLIYLKEMRKDYGFIETKFLRGASK